MVIYGLLHQDSKNVINFSCDSYIVYFLYDGVFSCTFLHLDFNILN